MSEQLIANNVLTLIKEMNNLLLSGTIESSTSDVHNEFKKSLDDFLKLQHELFGVMQEQSWYQLQNVETKKITKTINKLQKN
ncbi:MAG: spore coat protein [Bacilli bacterium]|nr:spore coat protein [Bacilli bacterium]